MSDTAAGAMRYLPAGAAAHTPPAPAHGGPTRRRPSGHGAAKASAVGRDRNAATTDAADDPGGGGRAATGARPQRAQWPAAATAAGDTSGAAPGEARTRAAASVPLAAPERRCTDPRLWRLRGLLRLQERAARYGAWGAFRALALEVQGELSRQDAGSAEAAALAEVAHLQLRVERALRQRAWHTAAGLRALTAARAYRRQPGR